MNSIEPESDEFWQPRSCLRDPIPEIFQAAELLSNATNALMDDRRDDAVANILAADSPLIREWMESLWGSVADNPSQPLYHRRRKIDNEPTKLSRGERPRARMPNAREKQAVVDRYGWNCVYCGIPLISTIARNRINELLPTIIRWGSANRDKHSALQCMTVEWDHVVPHCYGGSSTLENTVISCGPCNCGKYDRLLAHHGLLDPRDSVREKTDWDGLNRILGKSASN